METDRVNSRILIRGAVLLNPAGTEAGIQDILIEDGAITRIGAQIVTDGALVIEADGLTAAPGLVDMHVHLRDPGFTHKEDLETGCRAAAAGGVTSVAAMPNTRPVIDSVPAIEDLLRRSADCAARVYPIAAVTTGQAGEEPVDFTALARAGAAAFSDDGHPVMNAAVMAQAMRAVADAGRLVISHCEDLPLAGKGIVNLGRISDALGVPGLPAAAEEVQVAREAALAASFGVPVHIAHVSTAGSVAIVRDFKRRGVPITCETCPHYFSLEENLLLSRDADYRMNPPLRTGEDVAAIIEGLREGTIDAIVTDHAPHTAQEKADFEKAPNGVVGLETSLAAGITWLVRPGHLSLGELLKKMSAAPAKLLGIPGGSIAEGGPADLVLFDPEEKWVVRAEALHSKSHNTPYKGRELYGRVKWTLCRGKIVHHDE